jgi:hypothetical protein
MCSFNALSVIDQLSILIFERKITHSSPILKDATAILSLKMQSYFRDGVIYYYI